MNPLLGEEITLTATVSNHGGSDAADVRGRFFNGDPADSGTVQIGADQFVPQIPVGGSGEASVLWAAEEGRRDLFVVADPDGEIPEAQESDNAASREIRVLPDLALTASDITFLGSGPEEIPIEVVLRNLGGVDAGSLMVRFYDNDPLLDGVMMDSVEIQVTCFDSVLVSGVAAMETDTLAGLWSDPPVGVFDVHVVTDADSSVAERSENNNTASSQLVVQGAVDLAIASEDLSFYVHEGAEADTLHRICLVHNLGTSGAANVVVNFYEDHAASGQFLAAMAIPFVAAGDSASGFARWVVPETGYPSAPVYAFADAWVAIPETDEENNIAWRDVASEVGDLGRRPAVFTLWPSYPNPFRGTTYVRFDLPREGQVEVSIYDISGLRVRRLAEGRMQPGRYALAWGGRDDAGRDDSSGSTSVSSGPAIRRRAGR